MPDTLKPCPFCGCAVEIRTNRSDYYKAQGEHGRACIAIECKKCHLTMCEHSHYIKNYDTKASKLAVKWNRREEQK